MKKIVRFSTLFMLATFFLAFASPLQAASAQTSVAEKTETAAPAPNAGTGALKPLTSQLGQTLQSLVGPPAPDQAAGSETPEVTSPPVLDTFVTDAFNGLIKEVESLRTNNATLKAMASGIGDLQGWIDLQQKDKRREAMWASIGDDLLVIVLPSLLIGIASFLFLFPLRRSLKKDKERPFVGHLIVVSVSILLRLMPAVIFLGVSLFLLEQNEANRLPRFVILNVAYALSLGYMIQQTLRGVFSPSTPHLRLIPTSTSHALSIYRWLSSFCFVIVYAYFLIDVTKALRVPESIATLLQSFFAFVLAGMALVAIRQSREFVATILRGKTDESSASGFTSSLRFWLSKRWHQFATAYVILGLAVVLVDTERSIALMLQGTILSVFILIAARLGFVAVETWKRAGEDASAPLRHRPFLAFLLRLALWGAAGFGLAATWGMDVQGFLATPSGQRFWGSVISIALPLLVLTLLYEALHKAIDRHLNKVDPETKKQIASGRARTLLPMVRTSMFILFSAIALLMSLSAIGVNIAPLLAGAGVLGVAIGFGSQTLVKDFLTGLFIVAEDTIAVGDVVRIDTFKGQVETLSIRTIRLRDLDGSLHILPFSEVTKITNMTKDFAYAVVDVGVAYSSNLRRVMEILREIGTSLQEDPIFKRVILEPVEIMGVEAFEASSILIRSRIRTRPGNQADVRRLFLLKIKERFDQEGIEIPFQTITQIIRREEPPKT